MVYVSSDKKVKSLMCKRVRQTSQVAPGHPPAINNVGSTITGYIGVHFAGNVKVQCQEQVHVSRTREITKVWTL